MPLQSLPRSTRLSLEPLVIRIFVSLTAYPWFDSALLYISHIDYLVPETITPIVAINPPQVKGIEEQVGRIIGENLVPDEATLQLGKTLSIAVCLSPPF